MNSDPVGLVLRARNSNLPTFTDPKGGGTRERAEEAYGIAVASPIRPLHSIRMRCALLFLLQFDLLVDYKKALASHNPDEEGASRFAVASTQG